MSGPLLMPKSAAMKRVGDAILWIVQQRADDGRETTVGEVEEELRERGWWPWVTADGLYRFPNPDMPVRIDPSEVHRVSMPAGSA